MLKKGLFLFLLLGAFASFSAPLDSIGIEKRGGKNFVMHKVESKETLYSISRKYNVSVEDIKKSNDDLTADLKVGQIVLVPSKYQGETAKAVKSGTHTVEKGETLYSISRKYKVAVADIQKANPELAGKDIQPGQVISIPGLVAENTPEPVKTNNTNSSQGTVTHKVAAKETFYSIARKYSVSVNDLKDANPDVAELKIDQVLVIPVKGGKQEEVKKEEKNEKVAEEKVKSKEDKDSYVEVKAPATNPSLVNMPPLSNLKKDSYTKVSESGMVEMYQDNSGFHYALHKTAPVGTIIYLVNEETGQKVYVRVMGKLTDAGPGVFMKISPKAFEKIGKGDKVKVNASYIP